MSRTHLQILNIRRLTTAIALSIALSATSASAQGCTQCRDNVQAVPPRTRSAYREGILLLAGTALTILSAAAIAMRRIR